MYTVTTNVGTMITLEQRNRLAEEATAMARRLDRDCSDYLVVTCWTGAVALVALFFGTMAHVYEWRILFVMSGVLCVVATSVSLWALRRSHRADALEERWFAQHWRWQAVDLAHTRPKELRELLRAQEELRH